MLQRHKTKLLKPSEFRQMCREMIEDRPISSDEKTLLDIIRKYSGGNPYVTISYSQIAPSDWKRVTNEIVEGIIRDYLSRDPVDYIRLRWFYRRLAQIGHQGAIEISLSQLSKLGPCLANVCGYLASVQSIDRSRWERIGAKLIRLLDSRDVKSNEFFRLSILSLFSRNEYINHFPRLASQFQNSDPYARREILLAAKRNGAIDWLREHKEYYGSMDPWQRLAFIFGASGFPKDERKYFLSRLDPDRPFETVLSKWARNA